MDPITLFLLISGLTSLISLGTNVAGTIVNTNAQKTANQQNIDLQRETNAQNQYNLEHAHQIEMDDLEAAGLNPVLTAMGGSGAQVSNLQAPQTKPVQTDLSGVQSALAGMQSTMSTLMMFQMMSQMNGGNGFMSFGKSGPRFGFRTGSNGVNSASALHNLPNNVKSSSVMKALQKGPTTVDLMKKRASGKKLTKSEKEWLEIMEGILQA